MLPSAAPRSGLPAAEARGSSPRRPTTEACSQSGVISLCTASNHARLIDSP